MMPQPFLLAAPRGPGPVAQIERADRPELVCGRLPRIWAPARTLQHLLGPRGIILGAVFSRDQPVSAEALTSSLPLERPAEDLAAALIRNHWGSWFAVLIDREQRDLCLLVDPSGLLPVYRTQTSRHTLISSDPRLFTAAGVNLEVAWDDLRAHLLRPQLRREATCLAGVHELTPGVLVPLGTGTGGGKIMWHACDHMPAGKAPSFGEAAEQLRVTARSVIGTWARIAGPVVVAASGGVDSSLICAALSQGSLRFACATLATSDPSGDERIFVHALGDHLGVQVIAGIWDPGLVDVTRTASIGLPRPSRQTFMQGLDASLEAARSAFGGAATFDGNGGDNLFCFLHSAAPVLDRIRVEGLRKAAPTFLDMCKVTGCDAAAMTRAVVRRAIRGGARDTWPADTRLLIDAGSELPNDPLAHWHEIAMGRHGGKRDHLDLIAHAQNHINGLGTTTTPRFSPLMSQPMIELCLSIPTWLWCRGGINRALARAAFADTLPASVLRRSAKTGPDSYIRHMFALNRGAIRALLVPGLLARHGLIDVGAVEAALATDELSPDPIAYRLLDLVEAETWARSWARTWTSHG